MMTTMATTKPLIIEGTTKSPQVIFDPAGKHYEISGRSLPENVIKTYEPIIEWLEANLGNIPGEIEFNFRVDYLNSASAKMVSLILNKLEDFYKTGKDIKVNWYYNLEDEDIHSEGEIFAMLKKIPICLIGVEDETDDDF